MSDESMPNVHQADLSHLGPQSAPSAEPAASEEQALSQDQAAEAQQVESTEVAQAEGGSEETSTAAEQGAQATEEDREKWDSRFAALSRKEKAIIERERSLKEMQEKVTAWEAAQKSAKEDPTKLLEQAGMTFDDLVNHMIGVKEDPKELTVDDKYKALEEKIAAMEKAAVEKEQVSKQEEAEIAVQEFKQDISSFVESNADKFEIVNALGEHELIFQVIEQHYNETEEMMPLENAAELVEKNLEESIRKVMNLKKFSSEASSQPEVTETLIEKESDDVRVSNPSKTLTNSQTVNTVPRKGYGYDQVERSKAEAAKLLKWK